MQSNKVNPSSFCTRGKFLVLKRVDVSYVCLFLCHLGTGRFDNLTQHSIYFINLLQYRSLLLASRFQVVTGLLVAEVNVNTMCELGSGGVSLVDNTFFSADFQTIITI
jgi:hypothetical protein